MKEKVVVLNPKQMKKAEFKATQLYSDLMVVKSIIETALEQQNKLIQDFEKLFDD